ncbi:30S ribosomal protein S27ae [uncultured archaeon]|nr:30S ribosomal protein S27ae [uncultured archaeon]
MWKLYEVKEGGVVRKNRQCPKCRNFLAQMKNRVYCGGCGYTEIKK